MQFFDTHTHLNIKPLDKNPKQYIIEARENNITHIMIPGVDIETSILAEKIASKNNNIFAAAGLHPHECIDITTGTIQTKENLFIKLEKLELLLNSSNVLAVGECGLDYYGGRRRALITKEEKDLQKAIFIKQIEFANKYKLSLIVHSRNAVDDTIFVLNSFPIPRNTVIHCCESNDTLLSYIIEKSLFLGVDGDITYNENKFEFIKKVPLKNLVIETDAPFLLPEPYKSNKQYPNKPKNVIEVTKAIAKAKQMSLDEVASITFINACNLFKINI